MKPLLKIQSIPIKIEAQTRRASLQHSTGPAPVNKPAPLSRLSGNSAPAPQPVKITGAPANPAAQQADKAAQQQRQPAEYATRGSQQQQQQGGAYSDAVQVNQSVSSIADTVIGQTLISNYVSSQPAPQPVTPTTSTDYQMDKTTFDWNTTVKPQLEFVPAQIEYTVTQYPQLIIEYVGEPIYVPMSANPNYKGTA